MDGLELVPEVRKDHLIVVLNPLHILLVIVELFLSFLFGVKSVDLK